MELSEKYPWLMEDSESCSCYVCQGMCRRSCWPLPEEADRLMDLGYARRMMYDWWVRDDGDIPIIVPALVGCEGERAPSWPLGTCTFLTDDGLCAIHEDKPYEGRVAHHDNAASENHKHVAQAWDTEYGRQVVRRWENVIRKV